MGEIKNVTIPFIHPFTMAITGPTQCGKTVWVKKLIENIDVMIEPTPDKVVFLYTTEQPIYDEMKKMVEEKKEQSELKSIEFLDCNNGIPSIEELIFRFGNQTLLVLDDLMVVCGSATVKASAAENLKNLNNLVTRDSHHRNMSLIFICQDMSYKDGLLKTLRKNSHYHVVFINHNDINSLYSMARNKKIPDNVFKKIYNDVKDVKNGYLVFDGKADTPYTNVRLRTGVFPKDETFLYGCD